MSIESVCKNEVATIEQTATLAQASQTMAERHVGSLVVVRNYDGKQIPVGIITDRDLALVLGSSPRPQELSVEQIMRHQPITVQISQGILETILKMRESGVKRMPVVDDSGGLVGIVCADDLTSLISREAAELTKITETQIRKEEGVYLPAEPQLQM